MLEKKPSKAYQNSFLTAILLVSSITQPTFAGTNFLNKNSFYLALSAGVFQGSFNQHYTDQTDSIKQNISETVLQNGYTSGVALGYNFYYDCKYLLAAELSGNVDTYYAKFQAGAATAAFSDTSKIQGHFDLVFVPGLMLTETIAGYLKLGISYALTSDDLSSPVGFVPIETKFNSTKNIFGFASAIGIKKFLNNCIFVFAEGGYHDYGNITYHGFTNFTAQYDHSAHLNSYDVALGIASFI